MYVDFGSITVIGVAVRVTSTSRQLEQVDFVLCKAGSW